ncbi:MAG TPA: hypothetical protein VN109_05275 [Devosia sp.]|jgi:hypothetical protein|nr:hypothetical protein [Devosia sp.]
MSTRKHHLASQERVTKRRLGRFNFDLLKPLKLTPKIVEHGGYKVRDAATGKIVFGEQGYEFSATLEDIESWLETYDYPAGDGTGD